VRSALIAASALVLIVQTAGSQEERASRPDRVRAALDWIRANESATLDGQVRLCEVPAPPFGERARAARFQELLRSAGMRNVRRDDAGNVVGEWPGRVARPTVVLAAHLDTVFPEGTNVQVRREGSTLRAPGIGDNCRGLAVLLAVARGLSAAGVQTEGTIILAGTVGEEGLGDLRGARALLTDTLKGRVDRFVAVDGSGYSITNIGVASRRYRVTFHGSGGHSYNNFGRANPVHALGRAAALIADLQVPSHPKTTFNIGRLGGGTAVNALPTEAWMEIDLRSSDEAALNALDKGIQESVARAVALENARWNQNGAVTAKYERVGDRFGGKTDERSPIVQTALAVSKTLGIQVTLLEGSTDANAAMQVNIPSIAIGGGGRGTGVHSLSESFDSRGSSLGSARALLLAVELAR
jgi:tripeptide aminopeptidase